MAAMALSDMAAIALYESCLISGPQSSPGMICCALDNKFHEYNDWLASWSQKMIKALLT